MAMVSILIICHVDKPAPLRALPRAILLDRLSSGPLTKLSPHVLLTHDLTRAASALPLHTAALAFVSFGIVLVQVQEDFNMTNQIKSFQVISLFAAL